MIWFILLCVIILLLRYLIKENKNLQTTGYIIKSDKVDHDFNIVHLSDLHNTQYGEDDDILVDKVSFSNPDVILISGDLIDRRRPDPQLALKVMKRLSNIAPVYFVMGNHEVAYKDYPQLEQQLIDAGINVLRNSKVFLSKSVELIGIDDAHIASYKNKLVWQTFITQKLDAMAIDNDRYTILLSHMPQFFELYTNYPIDLTLSGHAHGGQIRIPNVGGIFAPEQGFFPKYDSGKHTRNGRSMIISRGVGRSRFPLRVNNNPEIIEITVIKEEKKHVE